MYRLYCYPTQNSKKVLYVLNELGVPFELQIIDLLKSEQKSDEFKKITPVGKVPVLQHNDDYLFESGAICRYLANVENSELYPQDKLQRAKVDQWMDFFSNHLGRWLSSLYYELFIKPMAGGQTSEAACDEAKKFIKHQSKIVDQWLANNHYSIGDQLTIADLFAYAYVEQAIPCKVSLEPYPNLKRWLDEMAQRNSVNKIQKQLNTKN